MSHPSGRPRPSHRLGGLPIHLEVSADLGTRLLENGEVARGLREIGRALLEAPEHPELLRLRALGLMLQGEVGQALECYHEAAQRWPEDALIACQLGAALAQNGDMPAAEEAFRRAIAQDPLLIDGWYNLGHALDARADTAGACHAFERVLQIRPDHLSARVQRGEMLKMLGRLDESEREFRFVLSREPDSVSAWVGLANLKTFHPDDAELEHLLRLRASGKVPEQRRIDLAFACAALLEQRGRCAEAYPLFVAANAGKRKQVRWNAPAVSALVDRILAEFMRLPDI
ncbi:MAG: tetratricopeptide repeat protein, partial [Dokdonella sp.]